ncbi:MAG TPA: hypothetical protein VF178_04095 [Gemmatimonadaceae bacterium]
MNQRIVRLCLAVLTLSGSAEGQDVPSVPLPPAEARLEQEFSALVAVRELRGGRVLLFDLVESRFMVADLGTGAVRDIARQGRGPREFENIVGLIALNNDSTLAVEFGRWHVVLDDSVVATLPPDTPAIRAISLFPRGGDLLGRVATRQYARRDGEAHHLALVNRASGRGDTVTRLQVGQRRGRTVVMRDPTGKVTGRGMYAVPLDVDETFALFPDGWIAVARLDPYRVDWRSPDGRWIHGAPLPVPAVRLTEREREAYIARTRRWRSATDWPEFLPPFEGEAVLAGLDGFACIKRIPTADHPETRYDVIDRQGQLRAQLVLPANQHILGFGERTVYVVTTDDDGLQFLSRHAWPSAQLRG